METYIFITIIRVVERVQKIQNRKNIALDLIPRIIKAKKKEAEEYLRDENTLAFKQSALYQKKLLECNNVIEIYTSSVVCCRIYRDAD